MPADPPTSVSLADFRVLSFDCYGTLIDWEMGILAALKPLTDLVPSTLTPGVVLETFGSHESAMEATHPAMLYSELLAEVFDRLASSWDVAAPEGTALRFGASVGDWPAFPDSAEALAALKRRYALVIVSNVDRRRFARSQKRLGVEFDFVFTAEDIGSYKPSLRNFEFMLDRLETEGFGPNEILHAAQSLYHDHIPANQVGLRSAWINRQSGRPGATPASEVMPRIDFEFASLAEMASAVAANPVASD